MRLGFVPPFVPEGSPSASPRSITALSGHRSRPLRLTRWRRKLVGCRNRLRPRGHGVAVVGSRLVPAQAVLCVHARPRGVARRSQVARFNCRSACAPRQALPERRSIPDAPRPARARAHRSFGFAGPPQRTARARCRLLGFLAAAPSTLTRGRAAAPSLRSIRRGLTASVETPAARRAFAKPASAANP
jgi:hypothetical protein